MEKTYKRIPFDIELAKKIQSEEIEGRIMYNGKNGGEEVIILSYNSKKYQDYPIRFAYVNYDEIDYLFDTSSLYIELPEETSEQKGELTLGKCKEGDEVWIFSNYDYGPEYVKVKVGKFSLDMSSGHRRDVTFEDGFTCQELTSNICWKELPKETPSLESMSKYVEELAQKKDAALERWYKSQETLKHEFKPFDKVLVRNGEGCWQCALFSHMSDRDDFPYFANDFAFQECIPYEGNQHLVGTTDKPE